MAQEGVEPSASLILSEGGLPVAYRAVGVNEGEEGGRGRRVRGRVPIFHALENAWPGNRLGRYWTAAQTLAMHEEVLAGRRGADGPKQEKGKVPR